jgi:hypothetical protein
LNVFLGHWKSEIGCGMSSMILYRLLRKLFHCTKQKQMAWLIPEKKLLMIIKDEQKHNIFLDLFLNCFCIFIFSGLSFLIRLCAVFNHYHFPLWAIANLDETSLVVKRQMFAFLLFCYEALLKTKHFQRYESNPPC